MLPGFQNAFVDFAPSRPSQRHGCKGKQRDIEDVIDDTNFLIPGPLPSSPVRCARDMDVDAKMETQHLLQNDITLHIPNRDADVEMAEEPRSASEEGENVDKVEPFDWKTEVYLSLICFSIMPTVALFQLNRIILTHSLPSFNALTFQILLGAPVMSALPADLTAVFSSAGARVLEVVANTSKHIEFAKAVEQIARSLVSMVSILNMADSVS